jgi:hypothetical protein
MGSWPDRCGLSMKGPCIMGGNRGQAFIIHCSAQAVPATGELEKRKRRFRGVTGAPCPSGRTAVSDPSVQRASKIPGRPCVGGNPGRTAHQRTQNISIRYSSRLAPKRWKRLSVPAATRQREPRDEAHVGVPAPSARSNQVPAAGPPLVPGSSRGFPGTQGLPEIFLTNESAGFDPAVTCGREDTVRLSPEPPPENLPSRREVLGLRLPAGNRATRFSLEPPLLGDRRIRPRGAHAARPCFEVWHLASPCARGNGGDSFQFWFGTDDGVRRFQSRYRVLDSELGPLVRSSTSSRD